MYSELFNEKDLSFKQPPERCLDDIYLINECDSINSIEIEDDLKNEILDSLYMDAEGDTLKDMLDNETLYNVISLIHKKWKDIKGIYKYPGGYDDVDFREDVVNAWDKALNISLRNYANKELKERMEC